MEEGKVIFVDLDGTLVRTDLFIESVMKFLRESPLNFIKLIWWLLHGIPHTKARISYHVDIDVEYLPMEADLLVYLETQRAQGRRLVLATAAHHRHANQIASHLGIFDGVLATDDQHNLKGRNKLAAIHKSVNDLGFAYAGDCAADKPIWRAAAANIFVNAPAGFVKSAVAAGKAEKVINSRPPQWRAFVKEMRPHQYAKNALIFVPLLTSHEYLRAPPVLAACIAFICFCLCASGVYFLNDLLDLGPDRRHARKRNRPLASGNLTLHMGVVGAIALPLIAFALAAALLPPVFVLVLAGYFLMTNAYSLYLKRVSTADVMTLALLYTVRVAAGAAATGIALSSWLLAFSVFVFASLGYLKRYIEVAAIPEAAENAPGRGYTGADRETMFSLGIANITAAVVILALYISRAEVISDYRTPQILWLACLLMLYWGNRIWVGARRGKIHDDPIVFALRDRVSQIVAALFAVVLLTAKYVAI